MAVDTAVHLSGQLTMQVVPVDQAVAVAPVSAMVAQEPVAQEIHHPHLHHRAATVAQASTAPAVLHLLAVAVALERLVKLLRVQDKVAQVALVRPLAFLVHL